MNAQLLQTLWQKFNDYKKWLGKQSVSAHTSRAYLSRLNQFLVYLATSDGCYDDVLSSARTRDFAVQDYKDHLKDDLKYSAATINTTLSSIDHFYRYMGKGEPRVAREELGKGTPIALTSTEQNRLTWSVEGSGSKRDRALVLLFLRAGLRVGECAALNVTDLDIIAEQPTINIRSHRRNRARLIALDAETAEAVREWLAVRDKQFEGSAEKALFLNRRGGCITTAGIDFNLKELGSKVGFVISAEVLRQTCLMNLLVSGKDVRLVRRLSGHKRLETTRRYAPPAISICQDFAPVPSEDPQPDTISITPLSATQAPVT